MFVFKENDSDQTVHTVNTSCLMVLLSDIRLEQEKGNTVCWMSCMFSVSIHVMHHHHHHHPSLLVSPISRHAAEGGKEAPTTKPRHIEHSPGLLPTLTGSSSPGFSFASTPLCIHPGLAYPWWGPLSRPCPPLLAHKLDGKGGGGLRRAPNPPQHPEDFGYKSPVPACVT